MERDAAAGRISVPDGDLAADMYLAAEVKTAEAGFRHYEISNWAIPGRESRHNLVYWRNRPFLGVGPGAHSYLDGHRFHNVRSPREYIRRLESGEPRPRSGGRLFESVPVVEAAEPVDRSLEMDETMMMGLRLDTGVETAGFAARFGGVSGRGIRRDHRRAGGRRAAGGGER